MTETPTTDGGALLAAIQAHPCEDTPRLMWADWLDEQGGEANAARAELIRVQVERGPLGRKDIIRATRGDVVRHDELEAREAAILREWEDRWRRGPKCERCDGGVIHFSKWDRKIDFRQEACYDCHGTGDGGGLLREFTYHWPASADNTLVRIRYSRGMKVVEVPQLSDVCVDGKPTPWLAAVVRHHPDVEAVCVLDRVPEKTNGDEWFFQFWDKQPARFRLPHPIIKTMLRMDGLLATDSTGDNHRNLYYSTADAANVALGRAVVRWARTCAQA